MNIHHSFFLDNTMVNLNRIRFYFSTYLVQFHKYFYKLIQYKYRNVRLKMSKLKQGLLISIEGIDGSGKSTLANNLRDKLQKNKLPVVLTYEPGDTKFGKQLREILHEKKYNICGKSEFLLFASDRAQHFQDIIIPKLKEKNIILSDRMADSSVAYQGYGRGIEIDMIDTINRWVMQGITPDITFYINISLESALKRLKKRKGRPTSFEQEKEKFTKKIITGFEKIFKENPRAIILDGEQSPEMLTKIAYANIKQWLNNNNMII